MISKHIMFAALSAIAVLSLMLTTWCGSAEARAKKHKVYGRSHGYFVPPPPPYAPSVLPETYVRAVRTQVVSKAENPYGKYIYERGSSTIRVVQPNKHVSYWNRI